MSVLSPLLQKLTDSEWDTLCSMVEEDLHKILNMNEQTQYRYATWIEGVLMDEMELLNELMNWPFIRSHGAI